jgi:hypothetical protein
VAAADMRILRVLMPRATHFGRALTMIFADKSDTSQTAGPDFIATHKIPPIRQADSGIKI